LLIGVLVLLIIELPVFSFIAPLVLAFIVVVLWFILRLVAVLLRNWVSIGVDLLRCLIFLIDGVAVSIDLLSVFLLLFIFFFVIIIVLLVFIVLTLVFTRLISSGLLLNPLLFCLSW
jgi:hypothetical protein